MRGSVTELMKNRDYGAILGEDGCMVYFDEKALDDLDIKGVFHRSLGRVRRTFLGTTYPCG
jgi:hypothetical protein